VRTLLWFLGVAIILMAVIAIFASKPSLAYFGLIGFGLVSIGLGFRAPEEM
jgi:hypothetical protein